MTRLRPVLLLCAAAAASVLVAGCGSTRVVRVVKVVQPCETRKAMNECVRVYAQQYQDDSGTGRTAHVHCGPPKGKGFDCVVLLAGNSPVCVDFVVLRLSSGTPYPQVTTQIDPAVCDGVFGSA